MTPDGLPIPVRVVGLSEAELSAPCCWCGRLTIEGIYRRRNPDEMPCEGKHPKED